MSAGKKWVGGIVVIAVAAAAGGYAYFHFWPGNNANGDGIVLYGNVDIREADLAFNATGRVETMRVEEGDAVSKGQLLATLESETYEAEAEAAEARIAAQRATLDRLLAGSRPEEIQEARANTEAIEADLRDARGNLRRTQKLATTQAAALQKLDQDRARVQSLTAQLKAAQQRLSLAIQGPRKEDIAEARAQLRAGEAELKLAQKRLDYTRLFAKEAGIIKTRIVEPGAVVLPQTPVYSLAITDPAWVRTYIPEPDLGKIYPGMKAQVITDSDDGKAHEGRVGFISPVAEFTPKSVETPELRTSLVFRVRIYVKNPDNGLRQGMPVTVRLTPSGEGGKAAAGNGKP